jgi:Tol biopolymer transport system component
MSRWVVLHSTLWVLALFCLHACREPTPTPPQAVPDSGNKVRPGTPGAQVVTVIPDRTVQTPSAPASRPTGRISYVYEGTLYLVDPDGSVKQIVANDDISFETVSWAPSHSQVVYYGLSSGELVIQDLQSGSTEVIVLKSSHVTSTPQWSSDEQRLVFCTLDPRTASSAIVQLYDVSRKKLTVLVDERGRPVEADYVVWGPSRDEITLTRSKTPFESLGVSLRYNLLSQREEQSTTGAFPVYSPDGKRVLYANKTSYGLTDIAPVTFYYDVFPSAGDQLPELVRDSYPLLQAPVWAPDGQGFAYKCIGSELWCNGARGARSKGDAAYILYFSLGADGPMVLASNAYIPNDHVVRYRPPDYSFSPDGQFLAYGGWSDEGSSALFVLNLQTGERVTLEVTSVVEVNGLTQVYPRYEVVSWLEF